MRRDSGGTIANMNANDRLKAALAAEHPANSLLALARALKAEGFTQIALYELFVTALEAVDSHDPRYDALADTLDLIWGGPWAKGRELFETEISEAALAHTHVGDAQDDGHQTPTMTHQKPRLRADFNGLFGDLLCLSHTDTAPDETGAPVLLSAGMLVTAFDEDADANGQRDDLIAHGTVEPSPPWLQCRGSRWVLRIDHRGVLHVSDLQDGQAP